MEQDFHFYTVYSLARASGFDPDNARLIAYSSQHTDDSKYKHVLEFENGGRFQQVLTAHQFIDPRTLDKDTCYNIWVPFHFLPGNLGSGFYERMFVRSNSVVAQRVIDDFLTSPMKPYSLHRLGIILHLYADTWSHQNFMGVMREGMNDVRNLEVKGEGEGFIESLLKKLQQKILEYTAPLLGHAQAGTIPDEPFREWEYEDYRGKHFSVSNHERALDAAQNCYTLLLRFLKQSPQFSSESAVPWQNIVVRVSDLFGKEGSLEERAKGWQGAIADGSLGFDPKEEEKNLQYGNRDWFKAAVKVTKTEGQPDKYEKQPNFESSNWKYFHDAAALQKFSILHEVLPEYGIICG